MLLSLRLAVFLLGCSMTTDAQEAKEVTTMQEFIGLAQDEHVWLFHFTDSRCEAAEKSPCVDFAPIWNELSASLKRIKIARVDLQKSPEMGQQLGIGGEGIPNVKLIKTKEPPAVQLVTQQLVTLKRLRKTLHGHMKGLKKDDKGFFLKGSTEEVADFKPDPTHYNTLEIAVDAKSSQIRKAFRKLSIKYHPDKAPGNQQKFEEITKAHEILSDDDTKMLYDNYGIDFEDWHQDNLRLHQHKSKHKNIVFFKSETEDGKLRHFTDADVTYLDKGLDKHTVIFFYSPWKSLSGHVMKAWKQIPDLIAGSGIQVGAVNCDQSKLCNEYGINQQMLPSIQIWALKETSVDMYEKPIDGVYRAEDLAHWLQANVLGRELVHTIDKNNFEMKVLNSVDPWLVVFCNAERYQICSLTRKAFNRMAYVLKPLGVKVGSAHCAEEQKGEGTSFGWWLDEWCEGA